MDIIVYIILIVLFLKLPTEKDKVTKEVLERSRKSAEEHRKVFEEKRRKIKGE